jgi:hypothetical protein
MPAPQVAATASPMKGFGEGLVSVFVPFEGSSPPALTSEVTGPIAEDFAARTAGGLALTWGDGSRDILHWSDGLAFPLHRVADDECRYETDACVLHVRQDPHGKELERHALDGTYVKP